jgi:diguanylate cyclase (GGDEF)-like protein
MTAQFDASLLLVDDDPSAILVMSRILGQYADQRFATSGEVALRLARESPPDLILLDSEMPGLGGFQVCEALKAEPALADIPVIFVTSHKETSFELAGFALGAVDFITKPVVAPLVLARVQTQLNVKRVTDQLRSYSTTDALTGVANRRQFDESLQREWLRAWRGSGPLALLMIDVDHFKLYNDHLGHQAGDECLRDLARMIQGCGLRPSDLLARYGGEEFALLLPQTPPSGAEHVAQRILAAADALAMPHRASPTALHVTVSIGIASYDDVLLGWSNRLDSDDISVPDGGRTAADLVFAADKALFCAKRGGRAQARLIDIADAGTSIEAQLARDPIGWPKQSGVGWN